MLRSSSYRSSRRKSNLRDFLLEPLCSACMIFFVKLQWGYPFAYDKCPILHIGTINTYAKPQGRCFPTITLSEKELPDNWVLANLTWFVIIIIIITEFIVKKHLKIKEQKQWVVILWRLLQNEFFLIIKLWYKRAYGLEQNFQRQHHS